MDRRDFLGCIAAATALVSLPPTLRAALLDEGLREPILVPSSRGLESWDEAHDLGDGLLVLTHYRRSSGGDPALAHIGVGNGDTKPAIVIVSRRHSDAVVVAIGVGAGGCAGWVAPLGDGVTGEMTVKRRQLVA